MPRRHKRGSRSGSGILVVVLGVLAARPALADLGPNIDHQPIASVPRGRAVEIRAHLASNSNGAIYKPSVFVRPFGVATFSAIELKPIPEVSGMYLATIPAALVTGPFDYYVEASDTEGNGPTMLGAPEAPLHVQVVADAPPSAPTPTPTPSLTPTAPRETVTPLVVIQDNSTPSSSTPVAAEALLGGGAAGVIGGVVLMVVGNGTLNTWLTNSDHLAGAQLSLTPSQINGQHSTANAEITVGGCLLGAGAIAAAAGLYLWLDSPPSAAAPPASERKALRDEAARHPTVASLLADF